MNREFREILEKIEKHKITISEAINLLNSLEDTENRKSMDEKQSEKSDITSSIENAIKDLNKDMSLISAELSEKLGGVNSKLYENMALDAHKMSEVLASLQQELEKLVGGIIEELNRNTKPITESLSKEIQTLKNDDSIYRGIEEIKNFSSLPIDLSDITDKISGIYGSISSAGRKINDYSFIYKKELQSPSATDLCLECMNGSISIKPYESSYVELALRLRTPEEDLNKAVSIIDEPELFGIKINNPDSIMVNYDVKIPSHKFRHVSISASKSRVRIDGLLCSSFESSARDTKLNISGTECGTLEAQAQRGKIELSDIKCEKLLVKGIDSPVIADNMHINLINIYSSSAKVSLVLPDTISGKNEINISQDGDAIDIEMLQLPPSTGIYIDAFTHHGYIELADIPGFAYNVNKHEKMGNRHIIGQTTGFYDAPCSVKFIVKNANGSISFK